MTLQERAQHVFERYESVEASRQNLKEEQSLQDLCNELQMRAQKVLALLEQAHGLQEEGITIPKLVQWRETSKRVTALGERFSADSSSHGLRRGKHWTQTLGALDQFSTDLQGVLRQAWQGYVSAQFSGESPQKLRERVATQVNAGALVAYEDAYKVMSALRQRTPTDRLAFAQVKQTAAALQEAYSRVVFDVPAEVKRFFDAAAAGEGAPLIILTSAVLEWLTENNMLGSYVVRPKQ